MNIVVLIGVAYLFQEGIEITGVVPAIMVTSLLVVAQAIVRPILTILGFITRPMNWATLGAWGFILALALNSLTFFAIGHNNLVIGFNVKDPVSSLLAIIILSLANTITTIFIGRQRH